MKKITLLVTTVFLMGSAMKASEATVSSEANYPVAIADAEPIVFLERGIEFYVFTDGQIDFNTTPTVNSGSETIYYKGRRTTVNTTHGAPGVSNGGIRVEHDAQGRIRRVGNVFMNYDAFGRIKRIGSVYVSYNRYALSQVGGLRLVYDRWGRIVGTNGYVNNASWTYQTNDGPGNYNGGAGYNNGNGNSDEDYYYYKQDGTKGKIQNKPEVKK